MRNLTAVMTMHERPVQLKRAVRSLRRFYPELPLVVVADGGLTRSCLRMLNEDPWTRLLWEQGADLGNSRMRNWGVGEARTDFVAVLEEDFVFTPETSFENMLDVVESDPAVAVCCGPLYYRGRLQWFANELRLDDDQRCYETMPVRSPEWRSSKNGTRYFYVDYAFNFFVMRRSAGLRWDDELKVAIEHIDFFIRLKKEGLWKAAFSPGSAAVHDCGPMSKRYKADRTRYVFWERFHEKHGYTHGINHAEHAVYDLVNRRPMLYPEYVFFLMKYKRRLEAARPRPSQPAAGGTDG